MSKTCSDPTRHALNGPTMGTRWSALFHAAPGFDPAPVQDALQQAIDEVDRQMSTWNPASDLMRLNAAPVGDWIPLPPALMAVLALGLRIGRASGGAFDIGTGDAVAAWGFGAGPADPVRIRDAASRPRPPAHDLLDLDPATPGARKRAPVTLDLNGIAKGYGVDRLARALADCGITAALAGIDGEMRAFGLRPDGTPWRVAIEAPDPRRRAAHALLELQDAAVATSGDYRHRITEQGRHLSHTMDPRRGAPLVDPPASVTVVAPTCAEADAWASALMVLGAGQGAALATRIGLHALILTRDGGTLHATTAGTLFRGTPRPA
ncbi:MAG: FAD:protein FMN transferase [Rubellimicrobium sp.]|nr:FAD:protein FMN transferase [Rubellimicrobium sp.]